MTATATAAPVVTRARVGWGDLLWLTWRRHRWTVLATAVPVVGLAAVALVMTWHVEASGHVRHELPLPGYTYTGASEALTFLPTFGGALIAVFWAAPLLSREYEQRTHLTVWGQDLSPVRWLTGQVVLLGVPAIGLTAGFSAALVTLMNSMNAHAVGDPPFRPFDYDVFEVVPQVQVGYAAFGFALGLALGAVTRRTVLSMGLALVGFFLVRGLVASMWRPYYLAPLRDVRPFRAGRDGALQGPPPDAMVVDMGYLDGAGNEVDLVTSPCGDSPVGSFQRCMVEHGITDVYTDYQPLDRLVPFQLIEVGVFTALAAGLLALAFWWVGRAHQV
ncbi:ABC transporter permease [Saccharothrix syringae]|uniref:ABC transporter permease n=1 Tax=Saccharothrix syringae TaxID=103733 RepID=A0A5Q0HAM9_SACSY|nr:ABC transporter permease [Saccharothrix syringae]QFZ23239.1 ABC transporter permease [Saccharothrix syringae]